VLVHDRFVFLQMRKTGSTFLSTVLQEELPSGTLSPGSEHADWSKIPSGADDRPVLVYVRNPWDWYVSWYHFNLMQGGTGNGYWRVLSERGELGFAETMRKALRASVAIMGADLFSTLFRNLIGDGLNSERLTVGRFESLVDDLERFLATAGVDLDADAITRIRARAPVNSSSHGPYGDYYDDELRELVGNSCQPLIERFGYGF
jgi:hypothetical protein